MTKTYDGQTARFLATVATCMPPLSGESMQHWINDPTALKSFLRDLEPTTAAIKKSIKVGRQSPEDAVFNAAEKFREDGRIGREITIDGVRIVYLGFDFKDIFLGKTKASIASATLHILEKGHAPILAPVGGASETTLAHLWERLKRQGAGQEGELLVKGSKNIAYIRDANGRLWAVDVHWSGGHPGWCFETHPVDIPGDWDSRDKIVPPGF
ncbi:MAG: hypothetical protein PHD04_00370 [Candidatus Pacebacteria bacterium]|nr:hypothetical protein [Candidatus Paceibacterota bacterium]